MKIKRYDINKIALHISDIKTIIQEYLLGRYVLYDDYEKLYNEYEKLLIVSQR